MALRRHICASLFLNKPVSAMLVLEELATDVLQFSQERLVGRTADASAGIFAKSSAFSYPRDFVYDSKRMKTPVNQSNGLLRSRSADRSKLEVL